MLVPAMKYHDGSFAGGNLRRPVAVKQADAVVGGEKKFVRLARQD
jgi:hypothetical protein